MLSPPSPEVLMNQTHLRFLMLMIAALMQRATAQSAIISADLHQPGDGLLTYDTINHREWLDLSETSGWSLTTTKQALAPGGPYQDFHIATVSEVTALVASAGYDGTSYTGEPYFAITTELMDLLHQDLILIATLISPGGNIQFPSANPIELAVHLADAWALSDAANGAFVEFEISTTTTEAVGDVPDDSTGQSFAGIPMETTNPFIIQNRSVWLYRDPAVPEPASTVLVLLAVCAIISFRRFDFMKRSGGTHER
jgi:hypothetical protein